MKILHVITRSDLGGAQSVVINLSNQMCSEHTIVVAAGEDGPMWDVLDNKIKKIKIREIVRSISPLKDMKAFFKLRKLYAQEKPDVVHLHSSKIGALGRLAFPSSKVVYSVHGFDSIRLAYRKFLPIEKLLKKRCKAIVVASKYDKHNMIDEKIKENLYVVYNGLPKPMEDKSLHVKGTERFSKTVMCIARVSPQKRFDSFIEIAKLLPQYAFVWIGVDHDYTDLPPNVFAVRGFPDAAPYIQIAALFVLPTNYEGIPISIISALSYAKPIVASDVGGISEIVRNGENGFVLENDNALFAEKISYILEDQDVYGRFSKAAFDIFNQSLTIDKMVEGYTSIYKL